ncbi:MAG TPA: FMN-binding protein [Gaiellaceae bacterium]|jgi:uncharacterized protein with FMN-binding domain|nr:FMN-binding protein [Gaiellaceae bacterium]
MRRLARIFPLVAALALPVANIAAAATATVKKSVWKRVSGSQAQADRWGYVQVSLVVKKTTVGSKATRKITGITVPVYPDHTGRSQFISENALPILISEGLKAQMHPANIQLLSGATYTSEAFEQSLQAAVLKAKKV